MAVIESCKKPVLKQVKDELKTHFKSCMTRATFLRNQGYVLPDEYKAIRNRIMADQASVLEAFD